MRAWPATLLLLPMLSGCIGNDGVPVEAAAALPPAAATAVPDLFEYVCPGGPAIARSDGLCYGTIFRQTEASSEPFVALHPTNPFVIAVGVNAWHTIGSVQGSLDHGSGLRQFRFDVFVSENAGENWGRRQHPMHNPDRALVAHMNSGDPALAFDGNGVLHVSGLAIDPALREIRVFYTSTPDLGVHWTDPVMLEEEPGNDRNWIELGPDGQIYVPWQRTAGATEIRVAYSLDAGKEWRKVSVPDCTTASTMVHRPDLAVVSCAWVEADEFRGVGVFGIDTATATAVELARLPIEGAIWPMLSEGPDGTIHLVTESTDVQSVWYARSADGGRNWTEPVDLRTLLTIEDAWENARAYWSTADPWGDVHLILSGESTAAGGNHPVGPNVRPIAHAVLRTPNLTIVQERVLSTDQLEEQVRVPPPPPFALYNDHYYGMDFAHGRGFLAWFRNNAIDYTVIKPVWNATDRPET